MVFNISKFSEDLLDGLNHLNNWPNKVITMQKNWIGKSFGCEISFDLGDLPVNNVKCFTTRPDTLLDFLFWHYLSIMRFRNILKMILDF